MTPNTATLSVPPSVHMTDLLADGALCKTIASFHADLRQILTQIQLDVVTEQNRDTIGPTLLGLKHVQDILILFKAKGDVLVNQQNKANVNTK